MRFACTFGLVQSLGLDKGLERIAGAGYEGVELSGNQLVATEDGTPLAQCRPLTTMEVDRSLPRFAGVQQQLADRKLDMIAMVFSWFWVGRFELAAMEDYFRLAKAAGARALKVAGVLIGDPQRNYWEALEAGQEQMRVICGFAEKHGVRALIELHDGYIHESASQARRLCEPFDPRWIGVIHDPENMIRSGKEHWPHSFDILGDYLAYVHWKNMGYRYDATARKWETCRTPLADGLVNWRFIVESLHRRKFAGYLANEDGFLQDVTLVEKDIEYMQGLLREVARDV